MLYCCMFAPEKHPFFYTYCTHFYGHWHEFIFQFNTDFMFFLAFISVKDLHVKIHTATKKNVMNGIMLFGMNEIY